jgi:hypothetical protein
LWCLFFVLTFLLFSLLTRVAWCTHFVLCRYFVAVRCGGMDGDRHGGRGTFR